MASYKILKQVDGLENVINTARYEAKRYYSKRLKEEQLKEIHYQRLEAICDTLETLGIVDDLYGLLDSLCDEAIEESQKCNS